MKQCERPLANAPSCEVIDDPRESAVASMLEDVLGGLRVMPKQIHCKYLYDERGSKLFDMICELDEYYPTRIETQITGDNASAIGACIGRDAVIVEYGSGSSTKTRILLDHLDRAKAYVPVDISREHLLQTCIELQQRYPSIEIAPVVADFTEAFDLPSRLAHERVCVYFPGSTIGNFEPEAAIALLKNIAWQCSAGAGLLIGFDLQKSTDVLERAYDDAQGITAEFNLNLLRRFNRELDSDFDLDQFAHVALYNEEQARIEIYIESLCEQRVTLGGEEIAFSLGEWICTEYSHKYTVDGFSEMACQAGLRTNQVWTDANNYFALMHLTADGS